MSHTQVRIDTARKLLISRMDGFPRKRKLGLRIAQGVALANAAGTLYQGRGLIGKGLRKAGQAASNYGQKRGGRIGSAISSAGQAAHSAGTKMANHKIHSLQRRQQNISDEIQDLRRK